MREALLAALILLSVACGSSAVPASRSGCDRFRAQGIACDNEDEQGRDLARLRAEAESVEQARDLGRLVPNGCATVGVTAARLVGLAQGAAAAIDSDLDTELEAPSERVVVHLELVAPADVSGVVIVLAATPHQRARGHVRVANERGEAVVARQYVVESGLEEPITLRLDQPATTPFLQLESTRFAEGRPRFREVIPFRCSGDSFTVASAAGVAPDTLLPDSCDRFAYEPGRGACRSDADCVPEPRICTSPTDTCVSASIAQQMRRRLPRQRLRTPCPPLEPPSCSCQDRRCAKRAPSGPPGCF